MPVRLEAPTNESCDAFVRAHARSTNPKQGAFLLIQAELHQKNEDLTSSIPFNALKSMQGGLFACTKCAFRRRKQLGSACHKVVLQSSRIWSRCKGATSNEHEH